MQNLIVAGLVFFTVWVNGFSQESSLSVPRVTGGGEEVNVERFRNLCDDFMGRLKAAIDTREMNALQGLYQTNGVSVDQLRDELSRWRPVLQGDAKSRVAIQTHGTIFRDFSLSNPVWKHLAERLTTHKSTHLVELMTSRDYWMLPLVEIEGRLFMVPSDKGRDMGLRWEDVQPDRAVNESQPVPSNTNSTSEAAGSRR